MVKYIDFKHYYSVYFVTNKKCGVLYNGVTNNLVKRIFQHKNKLLKGFTSLYNLDKIVYYETYYDIESAIMREKQLKHWNRKWKIELIEKENPNWDDLSKDWF